MTNETEAPERIWIDGAVKNNRWITSPQQSYSPHGPYVPEATSDAKDKRIEELEAAVMHRSNIIAATAALAKRKGPTQ